MKRTICLIISLLTICLVLSSCKEKIDYDSIDFEKIEDVFEPQETTWYKDNTKKSLWKTNIENFSTKQQIKLLNDLCFFDLPSSIQLDSGFSFLLYSRFALFNGSITLTNEEYKIIKLMLLKNPHWQEVTDNSYKQPLIQYQKIFPYNSPHRQWAKSFFSKDSFENYDRFEYFWRGIAPWDSNVYHILTQNIAFMQNTEKMYI